jgi:3-deoxy-manno-octulosonate cytidylyltransferase (CMP-KDO synthetase)
VLAVLPARIGSTRLPAKPLADIHGEPMIVRTWERAKRANVDRVVVATDDARILDAVRRAGGEAILTGDCQSGTDRVAEAARQLRWEGGVLNVQGDEPLVDPDCISAVADAVRAGHPIATPATALVGDPLTRARVKVVVRADGRALYFSRAAIPSGGPYLLHLGVYGFQAAVLQALAALPPSGLEQAESLEQLRWLEAGYDLHICRVAHSAPAVDTPEDLDHMRATWRALP